MMIREVLDQVLDRLPEARVRQVLDFAMFLRWQEEDQLWHTFSLDQLAEAYGTEEPDYSEELTKPDAQS
jgi:hypothetical protein